MQCSKSRSIIALRGPGQFIGEVLLFDNTGRDSPMGSWQTCVRARTQVRALILTVKDLKDLVTRKPAAEVELRAGQSFELSLMCMLVTPFGSMLRNACYCHANTSLVIAADLAGAALCMLRSQGPKSHFLLHLIRGKSYFLLHLF